MPCRRIKIETVEGAVAPDLAKGDLIIAKYFDGTDYRTARAEVLTVGEDYVDIMPRNEFGDIAAADWVRVGNRTDAARQAYILLRAEGVDAPCIQMCAGIRSWEEFDNLGSMKFLIGNLEYYAGMVSGSFPAGLKGYGIACDNVCLKGRFFVKTEQGEEYELDPEQILFSAKGDKGAGVFVTEDGVVLTPSKTFVRMDSGYDLPVFFPDGDYVEMRNLILRGAVCDRFIAVSASELADLDALLQQQKYNLHVRYSNGETLTVPLPSAGRYCGITLKICNDSSAALRLKAVSPLCLIGLDKLIRDGFEEGFGCLHSSEGEIPAWKALAVPPRSYTELQAVGSASVTGWVIKYTYAIPES